MVALCAAHLVIEEVSHVFVVHQTFNHQFRRRRTACGLAGNCGKAEPALNDAAIYVNVLDAAIGEGDFVPEKDTDGHGDTVGVKAITQGVIPEIQDWEDDEKPGPGKQAQDEVVFQQSRVGGADSAGRKNARCRGRELSVRSC